MYFFLIRECTENVDDVVNMGDVIQIKYLGMYPKTRKEKGLSQLDLSLQMGYKSVSIVSGAEIYYNGKHFNLEHLLKISQILDVNICDFFEPLK